MARVVVLPTIPSGGEDGVMRQQPRGVKTKESDFTCQFDSFNFSDVTFGLVVRFHFLASDVSV